MSDYLRFTKSGLMSFSWNADSKQYDSEAVTPDSILRSLRQSCHIDADVTLGDIFNIVAGLPKLEAFIADYSWCRSIRELHAQAKLPRVDSGVELKYLEISKYVEADDDFEQSLNFSGIAAKPDEDGCSAYSVSLSPMYELAHLPVRLDTSLAVLRKFEKVSEHTTYFTLLEILDAIYDDISFHGGPCESAKFALELGDMIADVEAGTAQLVPLDDVLGKNKVN